MTQRPLKFSSERIEHALGWHTSDFSEFEFRLVIDAEPFVLKNSRVLIVKAMMVSKTGRGRPCPKCRTKLTVLPSSVPSKPAAKFKEDAAEQLEDQWYSVFTEPLPKHIHVNAQIVTYQKTKRWADSSNLYQAPEDAMQEAGVLSDDVQIESHDGSRRKLDRINPRVEITLTPRLAMGET